MMKQERKSGATTQEDIFMQRSRDLYALEKMKSLERKFKRKLITLKVGKTEWTATRKRVKELLESQNYSKEQIKQIFIDNGYKPC